MPKSGSSGSAHASGRSANCFCHVFFIRSPRSGGKGHMKTIYNGQRDPMPKRRRRSDNPYTIFTVGRETGSPRYFVEFLDPMNGLQQQEITKDLFDFFDQEELNDISQMNEEERHFERSEQTEESLNTRSIQPQAPFEDDLLDRIALESELAKLSKVQRNRIHQYYYFGITLDEIAEKEGCSHQSVQQSMRRAFLQIRKKSDWGS